MSVGSAGALSGGTLLHLIALVPHTRYRGFRFLGRRVPGPDAGRGGVPGRGDCTADRRRWRASESLCRYRHPGLQQRRAEPLRCPGVSERGLHADPVLEHQVGQRAVERLHPAAEDAHRTFQVAVPRADDLGGRVVAEQDLEGGAAAGLALPRDEGLRHDGPEALGELTAGLLLAVGIH